MFFVDEKLNSIDNFSRTKTEDLTNFDVDLDNISSAINLKDDKELETKTSDLDNVFKSLNSDITGANEFIRNLNAQKKELNEQQIKLLDDKQNLLKERQDFEKLKVVQ